MVIRKKNHLVGLDIGSSFIKVAEVKESAKGTILKKFGITQIPPGAIAEGKIQDKESIAKAIRFLFKTNKIKEKNVAISTGGYSVVIKTITTNTATEKELQESIYTEAEQYIPYDIDEVNIDFQILGQNEFSPEQMNVLLVAVKKDLVAQYMDLIESAGLNPCIIDVDTFALQNIYEIMPYENRDKVTLLVDVGMSKTSLNILKGENSLLMRDNDSGTNQIIEKIAVEAGCSVEDAEQILRDPENASISQAKLKDINLEIARSWCSEIHEVVSTFQSSMNEVRVENIVLSGGGVFVDGFTDSLLSELDADISIINPFEGLIVDKNKFPESFITSVAPQAPIALGLALRRVDDK